MPIELIWRLCLCHRNTWLCANWRAFLSKTSYTTLSQLHIQRRCAVCFCSLWANKHSKYAASEIQIQSFKRNFFLFAALSFTMIFPFFRKICGASKSNGAQQMFVMRFPINFSVISVLEAFFHEKFEIIGWKHGVYHSNPALHPASNMQWKFNDCILVWK